MRRLALIRNPSSGSADEADVESALSKLGCEVHSFEIADARRAADAGVGRIVVAGGDGSIAPAAEAALAAGVPLAVIPSGTANDFAARMDLPDDPDAAAELAAAGARTRRVDLAAVGGRRFVNAASLGLSPAAADAAEEMKDSIGALAYSVGALQAAGSEEPFECVLRAGGETRYEGPCWQLTVGCTGAFGGGSTLAADATDGELDWVVFEGGPRARLAKHAIGLRAGNVEAQKGVSAGRERRIEVSAPDRDELNVDGELVPIDQLEGDPGSLAFEIVSRRLELVVPG